MFPVFEDYRLTDRIGPIQRGRAFNEWLRIFDDAIDVMRNPPPCCKAIYHQYIETMGGTNSSARRKPDKNYTPIDTTTENFVHEKYWVDTWRAILPGIRFIVLSRDLFTQAVSTYCARETGVYHLYDDQQSCSYHNQHVAADVVKLHLIYKELERDFDRLKKLFRNNDYLEVRYESLVQNTTNSLQNILQYTCRDIDISIIENAINKTNHDKRLRPMTRLESPYLVKALKLQIRNSKLMM
jgi:LPS sulfotransferase NodH